MLLMLLVGPGCKEKAPTGDPFSAPGQGAGWVQPQKGSQFQMVTGMDRVEVRSRWNAVFDTKGYVYGKEPAGFLRENIAILPVGRALDIAMGEGRNAVFLAKKGYQVEGVDISDVALNKARRLARDSGVSLELHNADLQHYRIKPNSYELIVNIQYLQRSLVPQIKSGLKRGGAIVFESYTVDQLKNPEGQSMSREMLLEPDELKELFRDFKIMVYRVTNDGKEAVASLVAIKP